jgi:hypothetical protein
MQSHLCRCKSSLLYLAATCVVPELCEFLEVASVLNRSMLEAQEKGDVPEPFSVRETRNSSLNVSTHWIWLLSTLNCESSMGCILD